MHHFAGRVAFNQMRLLVIDGRAKRDLKILLSMNIITRATATCETVWGLENMENGARGRYMVPTISTSQHCRISISASLGVTSCMSSGAFCASISASVASNLVVASPP